MSAQMKYSRFTLRLSFALAIALLTQLSMARGIPSGPKRDLAIIQDEGSEVTPAKDIVIEEESQISIDEIADNIIKEERSINDIKEELSEVKAELEEVKKAQLISSNEEQVKCHVKEQETLSESLTTHHAEIVKVLFEILSPSVVTALQSLAVANAFNPPEVKLGYAGIPANHSLNMTNFGLAHTSLRDTYYLPHRNYGAPIQSLPFSAQTSLPQRSNQNQQPVQAFPIYGFDFNSQPVINNARFSDFNNSFSFDQLNKYNATLQSQTTSVMPIVGQPLIQQLPAQLPVQLPPVQQSVEALQPALPEIGVTKNIVRG